VSASSSDDESESGGEQDKEEHGAHSHSFSKSQLEFPKRPKKDLQLEDFSNLSQSNGNKREKSTDSQSYDGPIRNISQPSHSKKSEFMADAQSEAKVTFKK